MTKQKDMRDSIRGVIADAEGVDGTLGSCVCVGFFWLLRSASVGVCCVMGLLPDGEGQEEKLKTLLGAGADTGASSPPAAASRAKKKDRVLDRPAWYESFTVFLARTALSYCVGWWLWCPGRCQRSSLRRRRTRKRMSCLT